MENKFTPELLEKAKVAKSAAELIAIAKENGVDITNEEAASCFSKLNPKSGDISDEELTNVAGGGCYVGSREDLNAIGESGGVCPNCGSSMQYIPYAFYGNYDSIMPAGWYCSNSDCQLGLPCAPEFVQGR